MSNPYEPTDAPPTPHEAADALILAGLVGGVAMLGILVFSRGIGLLGVVFAGFLLTRFRPVQALTLQQMIGAGLAYAVINAGGYLALGGGPPSGLDLPGWGPPVVALFIGIVSLLFGAGAAAAGVKVGLSWGGARGADDDGLHEDLLDQD